MILNGRLETERLMVRPFETADMARLIEIFADPAVARFVGDGDTLVEDEARRWIANSRANLVNHGFGTGAVEERDGGRVIGWAGVARPDGGQCEIIYGFEQAAWSKGYGRELVPALVSLCRSHGIDPIRATVDARNAASMRLLQRNGFALAERGHGGEAHCLLYELRGTPG